MLWSTAPLRPRRRWTRCSTHRRPPAAALAAPLLTLVLLAAAAAPAAAMPADALSFDLALGAQHCFRQTFPPRVDALAELLVVDGPPGMVVAATITDVAANTLVMHSADLSHETRALPPSTGRPGSPPPPAGVASEFRVCLVATRPTGYLPPRNHDRKLRPGETRRVFVSIRERGSGAGSLAQSKELMETLTKTSDLETVESTIDNVAQQLRRLSREIKSLRHREQYLAESGEYTAKRILRCSMLACAAIVVAGVMSTFSLQLVLTKNTRLSNSRL